MNYLFFDTETTGLPKNPQLSHVQVENWPRLVSIAWVLCDSNKKVLSVQKFLVKPNGWTIGQAAIDCHGITNEVANADGIDISIVLKAFLLDLQRADAVAGHNIRFDRKVIAAELYRADDTTRFDEVLYGKPYRDTMHVARELCNVPYQPDKNGKIRGGAKMPTLNEMHLKLYGEDIVGAHDAKVDIYATIKCFWRLDALGLVDKFYETHRDVSEKENYLK